MRVAVDLTLKLPDLGGKYGGGGFQAMMLTGAPTEHATDTQETKSNCDDETHFHNG